MMAQDRLWDERRRENMERRQKREQRVLESGEEVQQLGSGDIAGAKMGGEDDPVVQVGEARETEKGSRSDGIEERLEKVSQAVTDLRLELGREGVEQPVERTNA